MVELYHGLCEELMNNIQDNSIDLILCDLPYGFTNCEWDTKISFSVLWKHYNRVKKLHTPIVLFANQPFTTELINSNLKQYRYNWYWIKNVPTGFCFAKVQPMRRVEEVCVFYEKAPLFNQPFKREYSRKRVRKIDVSSIYKTSTLGKEYFQESSGYMDNVLDFDGDLIGGQKKYHPTQKPIKLLEYLIRAYTNINDVVLDNTMGSGSTGVAAVNIGRQFIGIEKEKEYFDIAKKRIQEAENLSASNLFDVESIEGSGNAPPPAGETNQEDIFKC